MLTIAYLKNNTSLLSTSCVMCVNMCVMCVYCGGLWTICIYIVIVNSFYFFAMGFEILSMGMGYGCLSQIQQNQCRDCVLCVESEVSEKK